VWLFTDDLEPDAYNLGMIRTLKAFLKDENAATAIEYGLIAAGISVAIISVVKGLGTKLNTTFRLNDEERRRLERAI
jgi:pilus assembly protein Flp/PilA